MFMCVTRGSRPAASSPYTRRAVRLAGGDSGGGVLGRTLHASPTLGPSPPCCSRPVRRVHCANTTGSLRCRRHSSASMANVGHASPPTSPADSDSDGRDGRRGGEGGIVATSASSDGWSSKLSSAEKHNGTSLINSSIRQT